MYLLFDIGGTNIRLSFSKNGLDIGESIIVATPSNFDSAIDVIFSAAKTIGAYGNITRAAGGIAGVFNAEKSTLERSPNLLGWIGKPLKVRLEQALGVPVFFENDAAIVALGEAHYGAGKNFSIVEYLTVSTGVGGARVVDGIIDERSVGFEPGQEIITVENEGPVTLENTVSGKAIEKRFGKKPKEVVDPFVWEELAEKLAYGVYNTIVLWSPDVVVLGGPMITGDPAIPISRVEFHLARILKIFPKPPVIKQAELGVLGGLWGALEFVKGTK